MCRGNPLRHERAWPLPDAHIWKFGASRQIPLLASAFARLYHEDSWSGATKIGRTQRKRIFAAVSTECRSSADCLRARRLRASSWFFVFSVVEFFFF